jgi:hypothetical protein
MRLLPSNKAEIDEVMRIVAEIKNAPPNPGLSHAIRSKLDRAMQILDSLAQVNRANN